MYYWTKASLMEKKAYFILDADHMIKLARNALAQLKVLLFCLGISVV